MKKCSLILVIFLFYLVDLQAETIYMGEDSIQAYTKKRVSFLLTGKSWILDATKSQFNINSGNRDSLISLLEIEEKETSTHFVILRNDGSQDLLVFSRYNLRTGQNYVYSLEIKWIDDLRTSVSDQASEIFSNSFISIGYLPATEEDLELQTTASNSQAESILDNNSKQNPSSTTSPKEDTKKQDTVDSIEAASNATQDQRSGDMNDDIRALIDSRELQEQQKLTDDDENNINQNTQQQGETVNSAAASMPEDSQKKQDQSLQDLETQAQSLWNAGKKKEAEQLVLTWIEKVSDYGKEADAYFMLASMYEKSASEIDDIKKAMDYYTKIKEGYILSEHAAKAQRRLQDLQNTYIFFR